MIDQLIIGDKASYDDFKASMAFREIGTPPKKSIKETVPFSNVTYDFSKINGEIYWEERELEYVFEIIADTPEKLEELKADFSNWIMNVVSENLIDPFIPYFHFVGTYADMTYEDDEHFDKTTATVTFTAYPYKVANLPKVYEITVGAKASGTLDVVNGSSHRITPTITTDGDTTLSVGGKSYTVATGETYDERLKIDVGLNSMTFENSSDKPVAVVVSFYEEVF